MDRRLEDWLTAVLESPEGSTFAILTDNVRNMEVEVFRPIHDFHPDILRYSRNSSSCTVFGRRVFIVTRERDVLGLTLAGYYVHSTPTGVRVALVESRCRPPKKG